MLGVVRKTLFIRKEPMRSDFWKQGHSSVYGQECGVGCCRSSVVRTLAAQARNPGFNSWQLLDFFFYVIHLTIVFIFQLRLEVLNLLE